MTKIVVEARYSGSDAEDWDESEATLRLYCEVDQNRRLESRGYLFGARGKPFGAECYPFIVAIDGRIDFGSGFENHDGRYGETNFRRQPISVGEYFNVTEDDEENVYKITKIISV